MKYLHQFLCKYNVIYLVLANVFIKKGHILSLINKKSDFIWLNTTCFDDGSYFDF